MTEDDLAPFTGWSRHRWAGLADSMLLGVREHASDDHSRIVPPGPPGAFGRDVDGLEGFARTFLLAGYRLAGEGGQDPLGLTQWYAEGVANGTDPHHRGRWVRPDESGQAKVEAASIALILDMTRPWIWDQLDVRVQRQVITYLSVVVGDDDYPHNNWRWFRIIVQTFLRSVGGRGPGRRSKPIWPSTSRSSERTAGWPTGHCAPTTTTWGGRCTCTRPCGRAWHQRRTSLGTGSSGTGTGWTATSRTPSGSSVVMGPVVSGSQPHPSLRRRGPVLGRRDQPGPVAASRAAPQGRLRRACSLRAPPGAGRRRGRPAQPGWHRPWPAMAQHYSGPSSPYWAVKGMLGLALPPGDPVWTSREEPLPVELSDQLFTIRAPGWLVSGARDDGIVRVINHGTDYGRPGQQGGDAPPTQSLAIPR